MKGLTSALFEGERTFLRYPTARDREEYLELRRESARFHRPWEPEPPEGVDPYSASQFSRYLRSRRTERCDRTLLCAREDGAILGSFNLNEIVRGAFHSSYLGYWVGAPFAGRGFMREGMELLLQHAFEGLVLHRIEANVQPNNGPSIGLVKGAGFRKEGFSPGYLKIAGRWRDHERWAILAEEWRRR